MFYTQDGMNHSLALCHSITTRCHQRLDKLVLIGICPTVPIYKRQEQYYCLLLVVYYYYYQCCSVKQNVTGPDH